MKVRQKVEIFGKEINAARSSAVNRSARACVACLCFVVCAWAGVEARAQGDGAEVRRAAETAFAQLRAGDFAALYDALPAASQRRIARERFVEALNRSRGAYELDRLETGQVGVAGDAAALDTTIYGRVRQPVEGEGRIEVRQYLVREAGRWRVITDDRAGVRRLLAEHPTLARRFPARAPRVSIKRDGRWVELTPPSRPARRRG